MKLTQRHIEVILDWAMKLEQYGFTDEEVELIKELANNHGGIIDEYRAEELRKMLKEYTGSLLTKD